MIQWVFKVHQPYGFSANCRFLVAVCVKVWFCCKQPLIDRCVSGLAAFWTAYWSDGSLFRSWYGPFLMREDIRYQCPVLGESWWKLVSHYILDVRVWWGGSPCWRMLLTALLTRSACLVFSCLTGDSTLAIVSLARMFGGVTARLSRRGWVA